MKTTLKVLSVALVVSLLLAGCKLFGPKSEKEAFVEATVKATCHIFQSENMFDPKVNEEAKAVYKDYGFDVDDETKMNEIAKKYSTDEEIKNLIKEGIQKECSSSVPEGMFSEPVVDDTADTVSPATDDTADTVTPVTDTPAK